MEKNQAKQIKSELIAVGIDVAMETLAICFKYSDKEKFEEIGNNKTEIKKLSKKLHKEGFQGKIIMESTGRHHLQTALTLTQDNLDVRVINPLISKKYSNSAIRKVKTDKRDSQILAEIAIKEERLPSRFSLGKNEIIIKKKVSLIAFLDKQIQKMNASINEYIKNADELGLKLTKTDKQIKKTIELLKKQKEELEKEVEKMVDDGFFARPRNSIPTVTVPDTVSISRMARTLTIGSSMGPVNISVPLSISSFCPYAPKTPSFSWSSPTACGLSVSCWEKRRLPSSLESSPNASI